MGAQADMDGAERSQRRRGFERKRGAAKMNKKGLKKFKRVGVQGEERNIQTDTKPG